MKPNQAPRATITGERQALHFHFGVPIRDIVPLYKASRSSVRASILCVGMCIDSTPWEKRGYVEQNLNLDGAWFRAMSSPKLEVAQKVAGHTPSIRERFSEEEIYARLEAPDRTEHEILERILLQGERLEVCAPNPDLERAPSLFDFVETSQ